MFLVKILFRCVLWFACMHAQSCPTLCYPMDCSSPGSSVHGILQARILKWAVISYSRGCFRLRDWTHVSWVSCIVAGFFTAEPLGKLCSLINMHIYCFSKCIISLMAETIPNSLLTSSIGLGVLCSGNSECLVNMNVLLMAHESSAHLADPTRQTLPVWGTEVDQIPSPNYRAWRFYQSIMLGVHSQSGASRMVLVGKNPPASAGDIEMLFWSLG